MTASREHPWENIFKNGGWTYVEPVPIFYEVVPIFREKGCRRILDLGCGNGRHTVSFAKEGFSAVGVDISPTGLHNSKQRLDNEKLQAGLIQCDFRFPLPFKECSFDGIWSSQVIHHARIEKIRLVIDEIWRILSPGGCILVSVSGKMDEAYQYIEVELGTFTPLTGPEKGLPHHIFTEEEVRNEFQRFNIMDVLFRLNGKIILILASK